MPIRVLHLLSDCEHSAESTQAAMLCEHLPPQEYAQQVVALRAGSSAQGRIRRAGATLHDLKRRHTWDPFALARLRRLMREQRPDRVHAWGTEAARYANWTWAGDRLVVSSTSCERTFPRATAASPVAEGEGLAELGLPPDARAIGVVARLSPRKRVQDLIWAIDLVRVMLDDVWLVIVGQGPLLADLRRFSDLACEENRTLLLGPRDDVAQLLPHFEMLWHAGEERLPPFAMLEAMAAGVPVVASRAPGSEAAIEDGREGLLTPPGDRAARAKAAVRLLEDDSLRLRMGEDARRKVQQSFPLTAFLDAHCKAYAGAPRGG